MILQMTIKTRNRLIIFFSIFSLILLLGMSSLFVISLLLNKFVPATENIYTFLQNFFLTKFNFLTVVISIFVFLMYVFVSFLYINFEFEKTQSTEIIYFSLFLIGCLTESFRLFIPCLNLWNSYSQYVALCSRIILFGRLLVPFSLVFMAICNTVEYRQDVERNILILIISAAIVATLLPLNSNNIVPLCHVEYGYEKFFLIIWFLLAFVTFISLIRNDKISNSKTKMPLGYVLFASGYIILNHTMNYILLLIGSISIVLGTLIYLKELHKQYLWN